MGEDNTEQLAADAAKKMVETLREKESKLEEKWNGLNNRSQEWQKKLEFVHPVRLHLVLLLIIDIYPTFEDLSILLE